MIVEMTEPPSASRVLKGFTVTLVSFLGLGTVSALWDNPFFVRMTPVGSWETILLTMLSMLLGIYVMIRRPACSTKVAGSGSVLGFLGIACPVCNKVLLLLFGGELLLTYFDPIRVYVAALGALIVFVAILRERRMLLSLTDTKPNDATLRDLGSVHGGA